ncbi:hypothetical protein LCGC14_2457140 [marine sediment metagenome]|uniref:Uncharacterized protein n=1 Tax=marine sediment metagenome TaxID=412755 RepID=A0A0F9BEX6_9ZZZZ
MSVRRVSQHNSSCYRVYTSREIDSDHPLSKRPNPSRPDKRFFSPATHHLARSQKITDTGDVTAPTTSLVESVTSGEILVAFYLLQISRFRYAQRGGL